MCNHIISCKRAQELAAFAICGLLMSISAAAGIITFDVPGAMETHPVSMNAAGVITGYYTNPGGQPFEAHGFVRDQHGVITRFDVPNSAYTMPAAINARGEIAGSCAIGSVTLGFLRDQTGAITTFAAKDSRDTRPTAMNAAGTIVGSTDGGRGFIRDSSGVITLFDAPGGSGTSPVSINAAGTAVGSYLETGTYRFHGFIRYAGGAMTVFEIGSDATNWIWPTAKASRTFPQSIDDDGQITGAFYVHELAHSHGFVRDKTGATTIFDGGPVDYTRADFRYTFPLSINDRGDITGYEGITAPDGFVRDAQGVSTTFSVPGCEQTQPVSINASGAVTGNCLHCVITGDIAYCARHGFLRDR